MPTASDQRTLATALAARDDADLAEAFAARGVSPSVAWRDFYDAAEGMLEPAALTRALTHLPHAPALSLSTAVRDGAPAGGAGADALEALALVRPDGRPFPAVATLVAERPAVAEPVDAAAAPADHVQEAAAAERAFTSAAALADILLRTLDAPLTRIGNGSLGAADRKALIDEGAVADGDLADTLVAVAEATGLLAADDRAWLVTPAGREWVGTGTGERWRRTAVGLRGALPPGLRTPAGGLTPPASWTGAYPFDAAWQARADAWRDRMIAWGVLTPSGAMPVWTLPLAAGDDPDVAALERLLPPEVDRVFLQNDLTAIAPGPLAPHLDVRLRRMAARESRAQASSYRFSADSIAAAITAGESAESLRTFLTELSLTGIPQPLAYVIERTAARHGLLRVGRDEATGRTRVSSDDAAALETLAVDQALRALGLVRDAAALSTRVGEDAVFWALADARYPVVAVDAAGAQRSVERSRVAVGTAPTDAVDRYADLIARLRASGEGGDAAWLERELDQAVRARAIVDVVVRLPDGPERAFRLEATGLGGGRLRGRDRSADVERTLPLASIASVHPVS